MATNLRKVGNFQFHAIVSIKWLIFTAFDIKVVNCLMSFCWPHISTGLLHNRTYSRVTQIQEISLTTYTNSMSESVEGYAWMWDMGYTEIDHNSNIINLGWNQHVASAVKNYVFDHCWNLEFTHTCTHTHTLTQHIHTHTHTYARTHARTHAHTHTRTEAHFPRFTLNQFLTMACHYSDTSMISSSTALFVPVKWHSVKSPLPPSLPWSWSGARW